jgi:hypothetical protein
MAKHTYPKSYKHDGMPEHLAWWYLSFVDPHKGWLGACCVEADSLIDAAKTARKAGCNPGGEVMGLALQPDDPVPTAIQYKLITDTPMLELILGKLMHVPSGGPCVECEKHVHE